MFLAGARAGRGKFQGDQGSLHPARDFLMSLRAEGISAGSAGLGWDCVLLCAEREST